MSTNEDDIRVRIAGDFADINKSLQELRREVRQTGKDAADSARGWGQLGRGLDSLRRTVVGAVAAYASFGAVSQLFRTIVRETLEAERVTSQLEARIQSTGAVAGFTAQQLLQVADDLQRLTTFGDEAIASAQTALLAFQNIRGDAFTEATRAALDLATALGQDLETAAATVGRALDDPVRGLTQLQRSGITLGQSQRELVKQLVETGDVLGAQRVLLQELEERYGGAAVAARDTFGGALQALRNAATELLEGKGGLTEARQAVEDLIDRLQDPATQSGFDKFTSGFFRLLGAGATVVGEIGSLGDQFGLFFADLTGNLTEVDRLEAEIRALDRALAGAFSKPITAIGKTREELLALRLEAEKALAAARQAEGGAGFLPSAPASAVVSAPVVAPTVAVDPREALKQLQSSLAAARVLLDDEIKRVGAALDRDFEENLVRFSDYFGRRAEIERQAIESEIEQRRAALQLLDAEAKLAADRGEETEAAENNRRKLVAEITALERQRADVAVNASQKQAAAEKELARQLEQVRTRLLELQGDTVGARSAELQREFKELLERLAVEGDAAGTELVNRLINVEVARTRLAELQQDYERTLSDLARAERRVSIEVETGVISEREGRRRIIDLHKETAAEVERLLPLMRELAAASGDPEAAERIKEIEIELEDLGKTAKVAANEMKQSLRDAGEEAFSSFLDGTKSAKDAFEDFISDIRRKAADLIAERLFDKIFQTGSTTGGGFFKQLFSAFHTGGIVGAGGFKMRVPAIAFAGAPRLHEGGIAGLASDEVPAILRRGEEVLTRNDARHRLNGGGEHVTINMNAPDAARVLRQSRSQIAADTATMLQRARNRNGA